MAAENISNGRNPDFIWGDGLTNPIFIFMHVAALVHKYKVVTVAAVWTSKPIAPLCFPMDMRIDPKLKSAVERYVKQRFPESILDGILIEEGTDFDGEEIVKVTILLKGKPEVSQVAGLTRRLWGALSKDNFGFPILSFRTVAENARLSAAA